MVKILFILVSTSWKTQTFAVRGHILHKQTLPQNRMHAHPSMKNGICTAPCIGCPQCIDPTHNQKTKLTYERGLFTACLSLSKFSCRASHVFLAKKPPLFFFPSSQFIKFIRFQILMSKLHNTFLILCRFVGLREIPNRLQAPALGQWMMRKISSSGRRWWFLRRRLAVPLRI